MRLVVSWLRDFVDVKASPEEIAETLGLRGFEVASVEPLDAGDAVIDFEVTANRPDCLSVLGLAREVATAYGLPLAPRRRPPALAVCRPATPIGSASRSRTRNCVPGTRRRSPTSSAAASTPRPGCRRACRRPACVRSARSSTSPTTCCSSSAIRCTRSISTRSPAGRIRVRRAAKGETIRTLDGVERKLDPDMLVIADRDRAAGRGRRHGRRRLRGVRVHPRDRLRERVFQAGLRPPHEQAARPEDRGVRPIRARRRRQRAGHGAAAGDRADGADRRGNGRRGDRRSVSGGRRADAVAPSPRPPGVACSASASPTATSSASCAASVSTWPVPPTAGTSSRRPSASTCCARSISSKRSAATTASTARSGLSRHHPAGAAARPAHRARPAGPARPDGRRALGGRDVRVHREQGRRGRSRPPAADTVAIANPLSAKFDMLRPSLLPGLVDAVAHNRRHGRRDVGLFEIGARFSARGETRGVAIAWTGAAAEHWSGRRRATSTSSTSKEWSNVSPRPCGVAPRFSTSRARRFWWPVTRAAITAGAAPLGVVGLLAPAIADGRGAPRQDAIFVAEIDLDAAWAARAERGDAVQPLPRHPFVVRDLSIVVDDALPAEIIRGTIQAAGAAAPAPMVSVRVFDRYAGQGRAERPSQPLAAADVPGSRAHADRRRSPAERRR